MPRHTTLNNYYALRYYGLEHGIDFHTPIVLLANLFSTRSLETMGYSVLLLTCGLPFLSRSWVVLAALPGLMLILISTNAIVHDYRNHYLAPVLPFLALSSIDAVANRSWLGHPKIKRWLPLFLIITPLFVTVPEQFKLIKKTQMHGETQHIHADAAELASSIAPHAHLLVDGNLGPFFHQFENIQVILGFLGNPNTFDRAKLDRVTDVVTLVDARQFGDCRAIKPSSEDQMMYDYQGFYDYCEWLKNTAWKSIIRRPASGMLHFSRDAL
jgi:hypothetical protein